MHVIYNSKRHRKPEGDCSTVGTRLSSNLGEITAIKEAATEGKPFSEPHTIYLPRSARCNCQRLCDCLAPTD